MRYYNHNDDNAPCDHYHNYRDDNHDDNAARDHYHDPVIDQSLPQRECRQQRAGHKDVPSSITDSDVPARTVLKKTMDTTTANLLDALTPDVERLLNRHQDSARLWYPHLQIDWGSGEDFTRRPWDPGDYALDPAVRSAIYVNLLTEDNLPYYTSEILSHAYPEHPLTDWNHQWTMEENRHAMMMRDWVHISRCIDPTLLEDGRRVQMTRAIVPHPGSLADLICYVTFQERATQIAHRNTMARLDRDDKTGRGVLGLIAGDETRHFMFYRDLTSAAFEVDPSTLTIAVYTQAAAFAMPGTGIPNFTRHAVRIARAGIYGLPQFLGILVPLLAQWDIEHLAGLSPEAERARDALVGLVADLTARAARQAQHAAQSALRTD